MKTTWKKGLALLGGVMVLLMNLVPSAVVFAEEGDPLAATEQVNQVAQAEATASVEENSTLEVSPEKIVPESSKSEEVKENSAETTVQEAKEEQKAEPASELTASSEAENSETTPKTEEERGETSTLAQQGGGDAGSSDSVVAAPEDKQSIEEKNSKMVSQPSIELREVTAKSDWASKRTVSFYGYDVEVDENNKVTITPEMENLLKKLDSDVQEVLAAELLSIESENVLFVHTKKGKNKPTKVFPENANSTLKGKFKGKVTKHIVTLKAQWDEATIVAPSWVDTTKLSNKERAGFHTVTINGKEAFTVKTDDFGWFYVAKKIEKPSQPTQPTIKTETFYTSNDKDFPVAMKDEKVVDIEESKKLLQKALPGITKEEDKKLAEEFIDYSSALAEILEIDGEELLFVKVNDHTTKVFHKKPATHLKDAFKSSKARPGEPVYLDLDKPIAPSWLTVEEMREITHFVPIGNKGFTLLTESGHWFFAPVKFDIVEFYTSKNNSFKVIMKEKNVVNVEETKQLLLPEIAGLPEDLKKEADDFEKNGTEEDVEIKEIEGVKVLFVKTSKHTKVFRHPKTDTIFQNAFHGGNVIKDYVLWDESKIVAPKWIKDTSRDNVVAYNLIRKKGRPIAYALKTKENHWFYAPIKKYLPSSEVFYTSKDTPFQFVVNENGEFNLPATKAIWVDTVNAMSEGKDKEEALDFLNNGTEKDVEIKEVEGIKLLFVKTSVHTKVLRSPKDPMFKVAFTNGVDITSDVVYLNPIKPSWATSKDIKKYNEVKKDGKLIGYTLKDADNHWFYAPAAYRVRFEMNGATALADQILPLSNPKVSKPADPARSGYRFVGWFADKDFKNQFDFTKPITAHTTIYVKWNRISSGGGGGGGGGSSSSSSSSSSSTPTTGTAVKEVVLPGEVSTPTCSIEGSAFSAEQNEAYLWACGKDITTIRTITGARLDEPLTRAELAKMMSVYVTQILGKDKVITGTAQYPDVDEKLGDLAQYIQLAYQLQIMGIDAEGKALPNFMPHQIVTRAEFATVFSRVLWGLKHNQAGEFWYAKHLEALKEAKILTNTIPMMQEIRGRVLLMLQRSQASSQK